MKKTIKTLLFLPLIAGALAGCGDSNSYEIKLNDVPLAYVNEEYDFSLCFEQNDAYSYSINVYYYDLINCVEKTLEVKDFVFTPITKDPISVVINADKKSGKNHVEKTTSVQVSEKGDQIEELLLNSGMSGYCDNGFTKTLNRQSTYIKGSSSKTSILCEYFGNNAWTFGGQILSPNNFRCLSCWKDQNWSNAILRFWVYNTSEKNLEFGLRLKDVLTNTVDIDMGQDGNPTKIAEPGKWTEIIFPLRPLGITHTLYQSEDGKRNDSIVIKVKYHGVPEGEFTPLYSFNFYVDEIDVVPNTDYPGVDTHLPDTLDRVVNTTWYENDKMKREINFDSNFVKNGESSIHFNFFGKTNLAGTQGMCLNSPQLVPLWKDQTWSNAILTFWVYNCSSSNIEIQLLLVDSVREFVIDWNTEYSSCQVCAPGVWTQVFFSMNRVGVNRPLYKDSLVKDELNVKFLGKGALDEPFEFYVDDVNVVPSVDYPDVDTTRIVPERIETILDGWENMAQDTGWQKGTISTEVNEVCKISYADSATSKKIKFSNWEEKNPDFAISPQDEFGIENLPDIAKGTLDFDVKFSSNITNKNIKISIVDDPDVWNFYNGQYEPVALSDGWYHVTIDYSKVTEVAAFDQVVRIGFNFLGVDDTNKTSAFAYIDNIFFNEIKVG